MAKPYCCGYCNVSRHDRCSGASHSGAGELLVCACSEHEILVRCLDCGTPGEWRCSDILHCSGTIARRTASSTTYQFLRECQELGRREREHARALKGS